MMATARSHAAARLAAPMLLDTASRPVSPVFRAARAMLGAMSCPVRAHVTAMLMTPFGRTFAPMLAMLGLLLVPVLPVLGPLLVPLLPALGPPLVPLLPALGPPLVPLFGPPLVPVGALLTAFMAAIRALSTVLGPDGIAVVVPEVAPVRPANIPGTPAIVVIPVCFKRERHDRQVDPGTVLDQRHISVGVISIEIGGRHPAARITPSDVAPRVIAQTAVHYDAGIIGNDLDHRKAGRRTGTHIQVARCGRVGRRSHTWHGKEGQ
jgi:hypothetical protein